MQLLIFRQDAPLISPQPALLAAEPYRASGLVPGVIRVGLTMSASCPVYLGKSGRKATAATCPISCQSRKWPHSLEHLVGAGEHFVETCSSGQSRLPRSFVAQLRAPAEGRVRVRKLLDLGSNSVVY